jgi:hypothetical protein
VKHIAGFQQSLAKLSSLIKEGKAKEIEQLFVNAKTARDDWLKAHLNDSELNNPSMKMPTYVVNARSLPINHRVFCHS